MTKTLMKIGALTIDAADYEAPLERTFRDAWSLADNPEAKVISVDMGRAREIWRDKIRIARDEIFHNLDAAFMRALEAGQDTSEIAAQKQLLRDAPQHPDIEAAQTPEQLIQFQPISGVIIK